MKPKTRKEMIEEMNSRIYSKIGQLVALHREAEELPEVAEELAHQDTTSDVWYELSVRFSTWNTVPHRDRLSALALTISKLVLNRNAYHDGLPFCPLCGKLGHADNNGAPVIDERVCTECNLRRIIPARIREAQKDEYGAD